MNKKEALYVLKNFYNTSALFSIRKALDTLVPELKETEDEKIAREIIEYIGNNRDTKNWIDWINKKVNKHTFKPTKEQLKVLCEIHASCINSYVDRQTNNYYARVIGDLYNELIKI